jgi:hypothetical protein
MDGSTEELRQHPRPLNSLLTRFLRLIFSLVLLGFVLSRLDFRQLTALWPRLEPTYLLLAIALGTAMVLLSAFKWRLLLRDRGKAIRLVSLFRFYLVGTFFNLFLPTSVGGDVRRVYDLTRACGDPELAAASVLLDRATGVLAMLIIGSLSLFFVPLQWRALSLSILAIAGIGILAVAGAIFLLPIRDLLAALTSRLPIAALSRRVTTFLDVLFRYRDEPLVLGFAVVIALVFQGTSVSIVYLLSRALGLHLPIVPFFLFVPLITLATMLPISINGVGVQETGYVLLFGQIGVGTAAAFSLSLLFHLYRAAIGLLGGLVYVTSHAEQGHGGGEARVPLVIPLAIGAGGMMLRGYYLWRATPFVDEPSSLLAAQAILRTGRPVLPSGLFYGHDLPFSYLAALFVAALGPRVESIRWLSLVASGLILGLLFVWGSRRFSPSVGLWAMAFWAVIPDAVLWGARGRSYALLQLVVLSASIAFVEGALAADRPRIRCLAWLLLILAVFTHAEAALLMAPWLVAILWSRGLRWIFRPAIIIEGGLATLGIGARFALQRFIALGQRGSFGTIAGSRPALEPLAHLGAGVRAVQPFFTALDRLPLTLLLLALIASTIRSFRTEPAARAAGFLAITLVVVPLQMILVIGASWQSTRYLLQLLPILALASAIGLKQVADVLVHRLPWSPSPATVAVVGGLLILGLGTPGAWAAANYPEIDYRESFAFVRQQAAAEDRIVTTSPAEAMVDLGRVDYFAMSVGYEEFVLRREGRWVDRWLGKPLIRSASEMTALLARPGTTWFVTDSSRLNSHYDPEFVQLVWQRMTLVDANRRSLVFRSRPTQTFAVTHLRAVQFENGLALSGYRLGTVEQRGKGRFGNLVVAPGQPFPIELVWQRTTPQEETPQVFLHLVGRDGTFYSQLDFPPLRGLYPVSLWQEGIRYPDRLTWTLPAHLPPGRYRVDLGLYRLVDRTTWGVVLESPGRSADRVVLDYVVVPPPDGPTKVTTLPETPLFGGAIRLLGIAPDLGQTTLRPGSRLLLSFLWEAQARPDEDYTLFVHLVDDSGAIRAQTDIQPLGGFYPTSFWDEREEVYDTVPLDLPATLPPGEYSLRLGWYLYSTGQRLALPDGTDSLLMRKGVKVGGDAAE